MALSVSLATDVTTQNVANYKVIGSVDTVCFLIKQRVQTMYVVVDYTKGSETDIILGFKTTSVLDPTVQRAIPAAYNPVAQYAVKLDATQKTYIPVPLTADTFELVTTISPSGTGTGTVVIGFASDEPIATTAFDRNTLGKTN